jgi:hypothetical protein
MNEDTLYDVCDAFGLRTGHAYSGGDRPGMQVSISCPLAQKNHGDPYDWNLSCSVLLTDDSPSLAKCHSFNCGAKGSFYRLLEECAQAKGNPKDLLEVLKVIAPTEKFTLESSLARSRKQHEAKMDALRRPRLQAQDRDLMPEGRFTRYANSVPSYIKRRSLTVDTCKSWGLGHDKNRGCLVFPVRRHDGKLVGLTGRYYIPDPPTKYHNYAGLNKSRYLYGEHMLEMNKPIIVCEGQIDAILTWQHLGIPTVACLGEGFSNDHARTICAFNPPVVYLFVDNDKAGRMAAEKIEYQLRGRVPVKVMLPPLGMDPGELTQEEAEAALSSAFTVHGKIKWN